MGKIAVELFFPGGTIAQYEQTIERMGFTHDGPAAPGGLFHWCTGVDGGLKVVDVWESEEAFNAFAENSIKPITMEVGLPEPQLTFYEVHNTLHAA